MKKIFKNLRYEKYYKDILPYLKKEKNQRYFTIILTLGASIFFALFAINPTLSTIAKLRREIEDSRFVEKKLSEKINNLSKLSSEYQKIQADLPFIMDTIPQKPEAPTLVAQIQSIAGDNSVEISKLDLASVKLESQEASVSSSFSFGLTGNGNYDNLQKFISDLVNMQRIVSVESISISKDTGVDGDLELIINGSAYFKK
ncbi:MAG: type 4a pilus biogenesis protein PilO [Candidatus Levybacteria bacterium]|nr:type 4a pilus biogenesis protein PilO [Candidatus Levybacteria bacterium]